VTRPAIVFAGAPLDVTPRLEARIGALENPYVIAADSGAHTALAFGLRPDMVIGDLDSLDPATRDTLERQHVAFEHYPVAKDATDGQLALEHALKRTPSSILLLGYLNGPRLDMTLSSVVLLTLVEAPVVLADERNECLLLRGPASHGWAPEPDELISLIPLRGDCYGITTRGLRYPLDHEPLAFGPTRGISNAPTAAQVSVSLEQGLLLLTRHFARL
jgi:thiamine pyrophosphokinase